jgi:GR25 family glycosyltransferase involved in LPS biosynthesis
MQTFVINLKRRPDRLALFRERASTVKLNDYIVYKAVDGKTLEINPDLETKFEIDFPSTFIGKRVPRHHQWNSAVIACALSHTKLWEQLANDANENAVYLIFEDDVFFVSDFATRWARIYESELVKTDFDLCFLGLSFDYDFYGDTFVTENIQKCRSDSNRWYGSGLHAYCLCQRGARKLLDLVVRNKIQQPIDHFVIDHFDTLSVYKVTPKLCFAENHDQAWSSLRADSDIQNSDRFLKKIPVTKYYSRHGLDRFLAQNCFTLHSDPSKETRIFINLETEKTATQMLSDHGFRGIHVDLAKDNKVGWIARVKQNKWDDINFFVIPSYTTHIIFCDALFDLFQIQLIAIHRTTTELKNNKETDYHKYLKKKGYQLILNIGDYSVYCNPYFWHTRMKESEKFRELVLFHLLKENPSCEHFLF